MKKDNGKQEKRRENESQFIRKRREDTASK